MMRTSFTAAPFWLNASRTFTNGQYHIKNKSTGRVHGPQRLSEPGRGEQESFFPPCDDNVVLLFFYLLVLHSQREASHHEILYNVRCQKVSKTCGMKCATSHSQLSQQCEPKPMPQHCFNNQIGVDLLPNLSQCTPACTRWSSSS